MANKKNLIPFNERTESEQRKISSKGGKASGEVRRKRKALSESMKSLLELPISNVRDYNKVARMGISPEDIDNSQLVILALFNQAKRGDVAAIKELKKMIGEDDSPNTDTLDKLDEVLEKIGGNV